MFQSAPVRLEGLTVGDEGKLNGTAYVTVYHTVNVTVGGSWLAVAIVALAAIGALWSACP